MTECGPPIHGGLRLHIWCESYKHRKTQKPYNNQTYNSLHSINPQEIHG